MNTHATESPLNIIPLTQPRGCAARIRSRVLLLKLVVGGVILVSSLLPARAMFSYWDANGAATGAGGATPTGTWGVDAYWSTNDMGTNLTTGWTVGNVAVFSAGADATGTYTINVSGTQIASFMSFEEGNVTLLGGSIIMTNAGGTINIATNFTTTLSSTLIGTTGLTKGGGGTLLLAVAQPYTGATIVREGFLRLNGSEFLPDGTALTVTNDPNPATFDLNGFNETIGSLAGNGTVTLGSGNLTIGGDNTSTTFSGTMTGTGRLTKVGNGTNTLTGNNNSVGPVTLTSGGIVGTFGAANGIFTCGTLDIASGTMQPTRLNCGQINLNGGTLGVGTITLSGFGITCSGGLNINGGTATLPSGCTFANDVTLNAGTLIIGTTNVVGYGTLKLNGGTIQHTSTTARIITNAISIGGNVTFNVPASLTFNGAATLTGNRILTVNNTNTIGGSIGEDAAGRGFTKIGPGILSLTGAANSYSGTTTISNGSVQLNATSTLGNGTGNLVLSGGTLVASAIRTVAVANPVILTADSVVATTSTSTAATFEFNNSITGTAGTLSPVNSSAATSTGTFKPRFSGGGFNFGRPIVMTPGVLSFVQLNLFNTNGTEQTFSGVISGDGSINRSASVSGTGGRSIFSAANLYTGTTTIHDGTLQIGNSSALGGVASTYTVNQGPGTTIDTSGILDLNGLILGEDLSMNGGQIINTNVIAATLNAPDGGVKAVTFSAAGTNISGDATVNFTGGSGSGAAATAVLGVTASSFTIDAGGSYIAAPTVIISAPPSGITATATATFTKNGGSNYTSAPIVDFTGGGGSNANYTAQISSAGVVTNFVQVSTGSNYTTAPIVSFEPGAGGSNATAIATMSGGKITAVTLSGPVTSISITGAGSGYTTAPTITFSAAPTNGVLATATGNASQFTVTSITTTAPGSGYTTAPAVSLSTGNGFVGRAILSSAVALSATSSIGGSGDTAVNAQISGTGGLTKIGNGTVTLNNNNNSYSGATLINTGTLKVNNTSGSATGTGSITVNTNGTLIGTGIITGAVTVQSGGTLAPGASIGTLTVSNDVTLAGNTVIEINKTAGTYDRLIGVNNLTYGGTLTVNNASGTLVEGNSFPVFSATNYTGSFTSILPAPGNGLAWSVNGGNLTVVVGAPTLQLSQTGNALTFSWSGAFKLQSQTNALNVGITTNWFDYPNGNTSPVNATINPGNPTVFFRLISQ